MAPLKFLEELYPFIDSNFLTFLEDFLIHDLYVLAAFAEQQPASEKLKQVKPSLHFPFSCLSFTVLNFSISCMCTQGITQILSIIDVTERQPWLNGLELLEDARENKHILSIGFERVDVLLGGGLREGQLTEIVGPSSSGKTQVCLRAASNVAKNYNAEVFYVDTGNSFSPQRISGFVNWKPGTALDWSVKVTIEEFLLHLPFRDEEVFLLLAGACVVIWDIWDERNDQVFRGRKREYSEIWPLSEQSMLQQVMSSISCHSVFDIFALFDVLHRLEFNLRSQTCKGDRRVQFLIIDSISSLITPILGGSSSQGHALMISAGTLLKKIAHEHNIAVLVTNHTVGGDRGTSKPALGESWKSVPHVRLQLSRDAGSNVYQASILKHSSMASGTAARFVMYE
ncbi:DNA repair protein RAD51-like protein 4 isoform X1 [Cucumis melo var. makuwa]|uniref:DNA repair protein RAD51-like protein 4 isoform X1 n=1 Tax=Cucumis melo var. makuwa TaxID=1194695 RepID=A0A5D3DK64_CUCMM|nr:DNA repair protein RAD51-like protein 4 isoform X1 [Cucumis melo var. makuwa]